MVDVSSSEHGREELDLVTIKQIVERFGVSRPTIHKYRRAGVFPQPVPTGGETTAMRFDAKEVEEFWASHPKRQGRRTDVERKPTEAEGDKP